MNESDWEELMGSNVLIKRIVNGSGSIGSMGTIITCSYDCYVCSDGALNLIEKVLNEQFKIGEGDSIPAVELALRHSRKGDVLRIKSTSKFAYGFEGRPPVKIPLSNGECMSAPGIPPDSDLEFEINVLDHKEDPCLGEDINGLISDADLRKKCGNRWLSWGDVGRAGRAYTKGAQASEKLLRKMLDIEENNAKSDNSNIDTIDNIDGFVKETAIVELKQCQNRAASVFVACANNLAVCHSKQGNHFKAKEACIQVLELQPSNVKALLRAANACVALGNHDEATACLDRVAEIIQNVRTNMSTSASPSASSTTATTQALGSSQASAAAELDTVKGNETSTSTSTGGGAELDGKSVDSIAAALHAERQKLLAAKSKYKFKSKQMSENMTKALFPDKIVLNNGIEKVHKNTSKQSKKHAKEFAPLSADSIAEGPHLVSDVTSAEESTDMATTTPVPASTTEDSSSKLSHTIITDNSITDSKAAEVAASTKNYDAGTGRVNLTLLVFSSFCVLFISITLAYLLARAEAVGSAA